MNDRTRQSQRTDQLISAMRQKPLKTWKTGEVRGLYEQLGLSRQRSTARHDLQYLAAVGQVIEAGPENGRVYRLNQAGAA